MKHYTYWNIRKLLWMTHSPILDRDFIHCPHWVYYSYVYLCALSKPIIGFNSDTSDHLTTSMAKEASARHTTFTRFKFGCMIFPLAYFEHSKSSFSDIVDYFFSEKLSVAVFAEKLQIELFCENVKIIYKNMVRTHQRQRHKEKKK